MKGYLSKVLIAYFCANELVLAPLNKVGEKSNKKKAKFRI